MDEYGKGVLLGGASTIKNVKKGGECTNYLNRQGSAEPCALGYPFLWWMLTSVQRPQSTSEDKPLSETFPFKYSGVPMVSNTFRSFSVI